MSAKRKPKGATLPGERHEGLVVMDDVPELYAPQRAVIFVDSIRCHLPALTPHAERERVQQWLRGYRRHGWIGPPSPFETGGNGLVYFNIHQPRPPFIQELVGQQSRSGIAVHGIDVALDLLADDEEQNTRLHDWATRHVSQQHQRIGASIRIVRGTRYTADRHAPRNTCTYADRPSKAARCPCVHIELRLRGERALRRAGVLDKLPANCAAIPSNLLDARNLRAIFFRAVKFVDIEPKRIGRAILAKHPNSSDLSGDSANAQRQGMHQLLKAQSELNEPRITAACAVRVCRKWGLNTNRVLPASDTPLIYTPEWSNHAG